jgi:hypothetical protein
LRDRRISITFRNVILWSSHMNEKPNNIK